MSMQPRTVFAVPEETAAVACACFPKGNAYLTLRDELGVLYKDSEFAGLFAAVGQPALAPGKLVLVLILQQAEGLSDRQAALAVRSRIDWKYLLGLELRDAGFDGSVLGEMRQRIVAGGQEERLLDDLLQRCQERGWLKASSQQRTDSTHVLAACRLLNRLEMVGETLRHALEQLSEEIPTWLQEQVPSEWYVRYGRRFENYRLPRGKEERTILAEQIGTDGLWLLTQLYAEKALTSTLPCATRTALEVLRQVWLQQYQIEENQVRWRTSGNLPPATLLIESPYEVEARFAQKREFTWLGYRTHLTESCEESEPHLVTQVKTTVAPTADISMTADIQADLVVKGFKPTVHLLDAGYIDADTLVKSQEYGIQTVGPVKQDTSPQAQANAGFAITHFVIDWEQQQATCPQGHTSRCWSPQPATKPLEPTQLEPTQLETIQIRFAQSDCDPCPLRQRCTSAQQGRTLRIRRKAEHQALQAARLAQSTPEFKAAYNRRAGIEATISQAVRGFDLRRSRYRGLDKTHLQNILIALAINLTRLAAWLQQVPRAKTRTSHFAALAPT